MTKSGKLIEVESLRGFACLLLVAYHVIGVPGGGIRVADDSIYRYLADTFVHVRMPLFTFISGFVYAMRPAERGGFFTFYKGKALRLLLPLVFVGVPFSLMQAVTPGANRSVEIDEALFSFLLPVNHYWYLNSLLLIFLVIGLAHSFEPVFNRVRVDFCLLALSVFLFFTNDFDANYFGINGFLYLLPFFVIGYLVFEHKEVFSIPWVRFVAVSLLLLVFCLQLSSVLGFIEEDFGRKSFLGLIFGVFSCLGLYCIRFKSQFLARVGLYSYVIFLFHTHFAVTSRIVLGAIGVQDKSILFCGGFLFGLFGPILLFNALANAPSLVRRALIGVR